MQVFFSQHFKRQLRTLLKKYPSAKEDLLSVIVEFDEAQHTSIGRSILKVRIPSTDMLRGKSGGFRSYIFFYRKKNLLVPLCIYAKSTSDSISKIELQYHLDETSKELLPT